MVNKGFLRGLSLMFLVLLISLSGCKIENKFEVTISVSENGSVSSEGLPDDNMVDKDVEITFTATPSESYVVDSWNIEGGEVVSGGADGEETVLVKITGNVTVAVSFKILSTHTVTFNVSDSNGTLEAEYNSTSYLPTTINDVPVNSVITFTATPSEGYIVDSWNIQGGVIVSGGDKENSALVRITEDTTVSVSFIQVFEVAFSVSGDNGNLVASYGSVNDLPAQTIANVPLNTEITFTATPSENYVVDSWNISNGSFKSIEGNGDVTAVVVVNSDIDVSVSFFAGRVFAIGDVSFKLKKVDEASDETLGDNTQNNNKLHQVTLSEYFIGETEVTQELWEAVMNDNPSFFDNTGIKNIEGKDYDTAPTSGEVQSKRPVETINWYQSIAFCNEITKKVYGDSIEECLYYNSEGDIYDMDDATAKKYPSFDINSSKKGFRLPTEAEWEYAARAGDPYKYAGSDTIEDVAWFENNADTRTHQVKKKAANSYGLYDMSGNVFEWCFDHEGAQPIAGDNPVNNESFDNRVFRGGSLYRNDDCSVYFRMGNIKDYAYHSVGLRLVGRL